jgi:lysophospholipase L1-like esterase
MEPPVERLGPGDVNDVEAPGSTMYLALGDSLAANVGVDEPRDGYVSRFHKQLQLRTEDQLGLRNLGIPGETSGSFILGGQLEDALAVLSSSDVQYITIDIGANDLLGHLGSDDCSNHPSGESCQARLDDTYASYEANLGRILTDLRSAAPDATIILLQFYNPFSLGLASGMSVEGTSDRAVAELNQIGERISLSHDALVADGFTPMSRTTASTTHILDSPPDIHPVAIGYDILASALLDALP